MGQDLMAISRWPKTGRDDLVLKPFPAGYSPGNFSEEFDLFIGQSEVAAQPGWEGVDAVHHMTTSPSGNDGCDENLSETEPRAKLAHGCRQAFAGALIGHDHQRSES